MLPSVVEPLASVAELSIKPSEPDVFIVGRFTNGSIYLTVIIST